MVKVMPAVGAQGAQGWASALLAVSCPLPGRRLLSAGALLAVSCPAACCWDEPALLYVTSSELLGPAASTLIAGNPQALLPGAV